MIYIRKAIRKDRPTIIQFCQWMAEETEGKKLDIYLLSKGVDRIIEFMDKGFYLLAEMDRLIVGQLLVTTEWSDWRNADFWWIQSVYVKPKFRKKGIYKSLHSEVVQLARQERDVCGIRLYVDQKNDVAQQIYINLGMKKSHYTLFEDDFVFNG